MATNTESASEAERTEAKAAKPMGEVIHIDQASVWEDLDRIAAYTVQDALNELLDLQDWLCGAGRYKRCDKRLDTRADHNARQLHTKAVKVPLKMPGLRSPPFETAIIDRYIRGDSSVAEALLEMSYAGVSMCRVADITEAMWDSRLSPSTVSKLNQKVAGQIEAWRNQLIEGEHAYVFLGGIWLKHSRGSEVRNISVLVAVGVNQDGYREILGVAEGTKEDKSSWKNFLRHLASRGLKGVRLFVGDKCLGLVESLAEFYPQASYQRCAVHFYRDVWSLVPATKVRSVAAMLKAIHTNEDREAARTKAAQVVTKLVEMKLPAAAALVRDSIEETFSYYAFPSEHHRFLRTNTLLERIMREIRHRTRLVAAFPDGYSALLLVCVRLRHVASKTSGTKRYIAMDRLRDVDQSTVAPSN